MTPIAGGPSHDDVITVGTQLVLQEVGRERHRQDERHGGPEHDDRHDLYEWQQMMVQRLNTIGALAPEGYNRDTLIEVAALAVAAVESLDRREA